MMRALGIALGLVILCSGAPVNQLGLIEEHRALMLAAIRADNARQVQRLIDTPYVDVNDPNLPRQNGVDTTYVGYTVQSNAPLSFQVLVREGADVNQSGATGMTPLMAVVLYNGGSRPTLNASQVLQWTERLMDAGANPYVSWNSYNVMAQAALNCGTQSEPGWHNVLRALRRRGVDNDRAKAPGHPAALHAALISINQANRPRRADCLEAVRVILDPSLPNGRPSLTSRAFGELPVTLTHTCAPNAPENVRSRPIRRQAEQLMLQAGAPPVRECRRGCYNVRRRPPCSQD